MNWNISYGCQWIIFPFQTVRFVSICCHSRNNVQLSLSLSQCFALCETYSVSSLGRCDSVYICLLAFFVGALLVIIVIQHIILMFVLNWLLLLLPSELLLLLELLLFLLRAVAGVVVVAAAAVIVDACLQIQRIVFYFYSKFNWLEHSFGLVLFSSFYLFISCICNIFIKWSYVKVRQ